MRLLILIQATTLVLGLGYVRTQSAPEPVKQYEVILFEGAAPESYPEEAKKDLKPEKPRLSMRVEEGEKFHAEGNGAMFEGKILSVKDGKIELRIDRSKLVSTGCDDISAFVRLNEAVSPKVCGISSIIHLYYFRVRSVAEDGHDGTEGGTPNNGMQRTRRTASPSSGVVSAARR